MRLCSAIALLCCLLLASCATDKRLAVIPGLVFQLTDHTGPTEGVPQVADERTAILEKRQDEPLEVRLGSSDLASPPAEALRKEVARLTTGWSRDKSADRFMRARRVSLKTFSAVIRAADLRDDARGNTPGHAAANFGLRALAQAMAGGSDAIIEMTVSVDDVDYVVRGEGRSSANPGPVITIYAFRGAVEELLSRLPEPATARR